MRKLKLLSLLVLPAVILPVALTSTSCYSLGALHSKSINEQVFEDGTNIYTLKNDGPSLKKLLYGTKSFNGGNYVVLIGTSSTSNLNKLLFNNDCPWDDNAKDKLLETSAPIFNQETHIADYSPCNVRYSLFLEEDKRFTEKLDDGTGIVKANQLIDPWRKYTSVDHDKNNKHKIDAYIRNDSAAKNYRSLISDVTKLFQIGDSNNTLIGIQWIKGIPVKDSLWDASKTPTDNSFSDWIINNLNEYYYKWK